MSLDSHENHIYEDAVEQVRADFPYLDLSSDVGTTAILTYYAGHEYNPDLDYNHLDPVDTAAKCAKISLAAANCDLFGFFLKTYFSRTHDSQVGISEEGHRSIVWTIFKESEGYIDELVNPDRTYQNRLEQFRVHLAFVFSGDRDFISLEPWNHQP